MDEALPEGGLLVAATQTFPEEKDLSWRPPSLAADPADVSDVRAFFFAKRVAAAKAAAACLCLGIVAWAAVITYA